MKKMPFYMPPPKECDVTPEWTGDTFKLGDTCVPVLEYSENFAGWSDDLTKLHEETAGDAHPIDMASRRDAIRQLVQQLDDKAAPVILEIGCSSGFMLRDMAEHLPHAILVGADVVKAPLYQLAQDLPGVPLMRFDLLQCPLPDDSFDAIVMLNVLEHIEDDTRALGQVFRLLKPGGIAVIEVPAGPHLYDAYDKALMHFRRYAMPDLVAKLQGAGFTIVRKSHLGSLVYPAFAYIKRRNQKANRDDVHAVVSQQAKDTSKNPLMRGVMAIEALVGRFISFQMGIRCLVTAKKRA